MDGLRSLGMAGVTAAEVEAALKELQLPDSVKKDNGEVLRAVVSALEATGYIRTREGVKHG